MSIKKIMSAFGVAALSGTLLAVPAQAQEKLRISLETPDTQVVNRVAAIFADELHKRVGDKIKVEIFPSAQLHKGRDVPKAVRRGAVEMSIIGTWSLDGFDPNAALQSLPMFYGVDVKTTHRVMDGRVGRLAGDSLGKSLNAHIPGTWVDLGFQNIYAKTKPINSYDDLEGMKIRYPGGSPTAERLKIMEAVPTLVPYPDLPMALSQGIVDGLVTTNESVASSKLWDSGIRYTFQDGSYFGQYVPMINLDFYERQSDDVKRGIDDAWAVAAERSRDMAAKSQEKALQTLVDNGISVVVPEPSDVVAMRKRLMSVQDSLVKEMKIDQQAVDAAMEELKAAGVEF